MLPKLLAGRLGCCCCYTMPTARRETHQLTTTMYHHTSTPQKRLLPPPASTISQRSRSAVRAWPRDSSCMQRNRQVAAPAAAAPAAAAAAALRLRAAGRVLCGQRYWQASRVGSATPMKAF